MLLITICMDSVGRSTAVYRWVDENGNVQFGDSPPDNAPSERVQIDSTAPPPVPDEGELRRRGPLEQADVQAQRQLHDAYVSTGAQVETADQSQRCAAARRDYLVLTYGAPVYRDDAGQLQVRWRSDTYQGPRAYLDDAARSTELTSVRQQLSAVCSDPYSAAEMSAVRARWISAQQCAAARADLEQMRKPSSRTSPDEIADQQRQLQRYCSPP
jgi:hypothetical protein